MPVMALFVPSAAQCFAVTGPIVSIFGLLWLMRHAQEGVEKIFPHWKWERELGWLNIRAHRRAETILCWIRHGVHAGLLTALIGILWVAAVFGNFHEWDDPIAVGYLLLRVPILMAGLIAWVLYFTTALAPRLRAEYEEDELERYRRENPDAEADAKANRPRGIEGIAIWETPEKSSMRRW